MGPKKTTELMLEFCENIFMNHLKEFIKGAKWVWNSRFFPSPVESSRFVNLLTTFQNEVFCYTDGYQRFHKFCNVMEWHILW